MDSPPGPFRRVDNAGGFAEARRLQGFAPESGLCARRGSKTQQAPASVESYGVGHPAGRGLKKERGVAEIKKILVLEDESGIRSFVVINLRRNGYEPIEAATGEEALAAIASAPDIDVALLDVMLPDIDGFEVCRRIRASGSKMGVIMLTALGQEMDKVTGLMNGADDYVTKPFSPAELIARVDALCRRLGAAEEPEEPELTSGPFLLNPRNRTLDKNGERVKLTQTEYSIMKLFMENPGKALSREDILENVWGADYKGELKIVDVNIRRLRIKIEDNPTSPEYITTIWGYGYKWGS